MDLSNKIRAIREAKRIKKSEVADALNMYHANYLRLEKNANSITIKKLSDIAAVLGVTIDEILHYGEEKILSIEDKQQLNSLQTRIVELESIIKDKEMIISLLTKGKN